MTTQNNICNDVISLYPLATESEINNHTLSMSAVITNTGLLQVCLIKQGLDEQKEASADKAKRKISD